MRTAPYASGAGASSVPGLAAQGAACPPATLHPPDTTAASAQPDPRPAHPARPTCPTRPACHAPPVPSASGTAPCASASARAHAPAHLRGTGRAHPPSSAPDAARVRVACGADRGPAGVRSAVSHRHDGELDYHSDTAPNPGRQVRPALGFAAPAWALSVGTDGLGHTISTLPREAC